MQEEYVCWAIQFAGDQLGQRRVAADLVGMIEDRVGPGSASVSTWLICVAGIPYNEVYTGDAQKSRDRLRSYRIRWIDDMIKTLENGGEL